jgi:hypothetical protein
MPPRPREPFIEYVDILHGCFPLESAYAAEIPAVKSTQRLNLHPKATAKWPTAIRSISG